MPDQTAATLATHRSSGCISLFGDPTENQSGKLHDISAHIGANDAISLRLRIVRDVDRAQATAQPTNSEMPLISPNQRRPPFPNSLRIVQDCLAIGSSDRAHHRF